MGLGNLIFDNNKNIHNLTLFFVTVGTPENLAKDLHFKVLIP